MAQAFGSHTNGLSPTQSVPVVRMGVLLVNVGYRSSDAKLFAGDATNGPGHAHGSSQAQNVRVVHVGLLLANVRCCGSDGKPISDDANNGATTRCWDTIKTRAGSVVFGIALPLACHTHLACHPHRMCL